MFTVQFATPERFEREADLRARFGSDRIDLAPDSLLTLSGSVTIGTEVRFAGICSLGDGTSIGNGSQLTDTVLGADNRVRPYSILLNVRVGDRNLIGPFAFLRDAVVAGHECILGAHVEVARSNFGTGVKVSHRAFIGDAAIGDGTIVGAGVVFCNWDGTGRQSTKIGAGVIIGSGSLLVPPLSVGDSAIIAAGSTVVRDVSAGTKLIQKRG